MTNDSLRETQKIFGSRRTWVHMLLLLVAVPVGILSAWLLLDPSTKELWTRAAGGKDPAALLELVHRASVSPEVSEGLEQFFEQDAGAMRALAGLAVSHEDAMLRLLAQIRLHPESIVYMRDLEIDHSFALDLLQRMPVEAIETLTLYAEKCPNACFVLGVAHEVGGYHVPQSWELAAMWYGRAYAGGYAPAVSPYAAAAYQAGDEARRMARDDSAAAEWFLAAAECGHAGAQCALGVCYAEKQDYAASVYWFKQAAAQGRRDAQFNLGMCYLHGEGLPRNSAEALRWFRMSAEQQDDLAQYYVGRAYELGDGVPLDYDTAVYWYRKSVEQQCAAAQCALGHCYAQGRGVPQNWTLAVRYYKLSAAQGRNEAQLALADCYENGYGELRDAAKAQYWRNRAASSSK